MQQDDIKEQVDFIRWDNPASACGTASRPDPRQQGYALGHMATGRAGRVSGTYEKPVPRLPYVIVYSLVLDQGQETVFVLRVIHAARDWPPESWPE